MSPQNPIWQYMPFNDSLRTALKDDPGLVDALKISHPEKFAAVPAIIISPPTVTEVAEVLGVFVVELNPLKSGRLLVKQDFLAKWPQGWTYYTTGAHKHNHPRVKPLGEFSSVFGQGVHFGNGNNPVHLDYLDHHYHTLDELGKQIRPIIREVALDACRRLKVDPKSVKGLS